MDLWKYGQILTIQKSLSVKPLKFSKNKFLIWVYHLVLHYMLIWIKKLEFKSKWKFPFCDVLIKRLIHIFWLQKSITTNKWILYQ
jgi:hypothetical protein